MGINPILASYCNQNLSQDRIKSLLDEHYDTITRKVNMVCNPKGRSLLLNGDAGMGKTEFATEIVSRYQEESGIQCGFHSGTLSPVGLYCLMYQYRKKGQVLVVDDTDNILEKTESVEILKAGNDTKENKKLTWGKAYSSTLSARNVPPEYYYNGKIIIVTNMKIDYPPTKTPTQKQQRIMPLKSRFSYCPAGLPSNEFKVLALNMFAENYKSKFSDQVYSLRCKKDIDIESAGYTPSNEVQEEEIRTRLLDEVLEWIDSNKDNLTEISFRTVAKIIQTRNLEPDHWKKLSLTDMGI